MRGGLGIFASSYFMGAAPVVASTSTFAKNYIPSGFTANIAAPSGITAGDLILIFTNTEYIPNTLTISGFTQRVIETSAGYGYDKEVRVFEKIADGTEGSSFGILVANGSQTSAVAARITGVSAAPYDTYATASTGGNYWIERSFPAITTSVDNTLGIYYLGGGVLLDNSSIPGLTLHTNTTENYLYSKTITTAGVVPQIDFNQPTTYDLWVSVSLSYKPI